MHACMRICTHACMQFMQYSIMINAISKVELKRCLVL